MTRQNCYGTKYFKTAQTKGAPTPDAPMTEAMTSKEGLELTVELGQESVALEVDCYNLTGLLWSRPIDFIPL